MISFTDILVLIGMTALRFGAPLAIVVGLGYLLKRLDQRWEREARAEQEQQVAERPAVQPTIQPTIPAPRPARAPLPGPQGPFIIPPPPTPEQRPGLGVAQPGMAPRSGPQSRSDQPKARCAAPQGQDKPCWQGRFDAEGHIPDECVSCDIFQRYPRM